MIICKLDLLDGKGKVDVAVKSYAETDKVHPNIKRWWEELMDRRQIHLAASPSR